MDRRSTSRRDGGARSVDLARFAYHRHAVLALLLVQPAKAADRSSALAWCLVMVDYLAVAAASWGVLMAVSPALQIRRMLVRRSSADVSLAYLGVLEIGFTLWIAYGISLGNLALILPNSVAFAFGATTILVALRLRSGD